MNQNTGGFMNKKIPQTNQIPTPILQHLRKQQESSQSIKAYCQENGIPVQTFYYWRQRLKKQDTSKMESSPRQVSFASLGTLSTQLQPQVLFDIRFPGGTAISIYTGTTAEEFAPFLKLVSRRNILC
jgi:hypothetical protein